VEGGTEKVGGINLPAAEGGKAVEGEEGGCQGASQQPAHRGRQGHARVRHAQLLRVVELVHQVPHAFPPATHGHLACLSLGLVQGYPFLNVLPSFLPSFPFQSCWKLFDVVGLLLERREQPSNKKW
jgi:hypothetical protein